MEREASLQGLEVKGLQRLLASLRLSGTVALSSDGALATSAFIGAKISLSRIVKFTKELLWATRSGTQGPEPVGGT